jgi:hypothetical protein
MDFFHVSPAYDDYKSLPNFIQSAQIFATSPLLVRQLRFTSGDPMTWICFGSLGFANIKYQLRGSIQFSRSSRSIGKCPLIDRRLSALRLFVLREFQVSNLPPPELTISDGPNSLGRSNARDFLWTI